MLGKKVKIFCLVLFCVIQSIHAQTGAISDPTGNWWLGGNIGGTFHNSEVKSVLNYGWGLTLERFIYKRYHSPIAISARLRYLAGQLEGQDNSLSTNTLFNDALNGTNSNATDYNSGGEPVVHNFLSEFHNLGLEAVLYLNALRKMNINFYLFGGADVMWYKTLTDQLDGNGNRYDYNNLDLNAISTARDGTYETNADGSDGTFKARFAPAFGLGLGYIFNYRWSVGIEHKITFPNTDLLDGQRWTADNTTTGDNDVFHYTSLTLGFGIGGTAINTGNTNSTTKVTPPPSIEMIWPSTENHHSSSCEMNIVATIYNISKEEQVKVFQGVIELSPLAINFDEVTGRLQVQTQINETTDFRIVANAKSGVAEKKFTISCGEKDEPKETIVETAPDPEPKLATPFIDIDLPKTKSISSSDCQMNVVAYLPNTETKSFITIEENGVKLPSAAYYFSIANKKLTLNREFKDKTTLRIKVTNSVTEVSETLTFNCIPEEAPVQIQGEKPEIIMLKPTENPFRTLECEVEVMAEILNIDNETQLSVRQNGVLLSPGEYAYNPGSKILKMNRPIEKYTRLEILASNEYGEDIENLRLQCEPPLYDRPDVVLPKPFISMQSNITNPAFLKTCKANFNMNVFNVSNKGDITVTVNGKALNPSNYSYNSSSRTLNINTPFSSKAEFIITARNQGGITSYTQVVECVKTPEVSKPTITLISPTTSTTTLEDCKARVEASITGIENKNGIVVKAGESRLPAYLYSFNVASKEFFIQKPFEGSVTYTIEAKNEAGSAMKSVTFNCVPKQEQTQPVVQKPLIKIVAPKTESFASKDCTERIYGNIEHIDKKSQATVLVNNRPVDFSYNEITKRFSVDVSVVGTTSVQIKALNEAGTATKSYVITCEAPAEEPEVNILSPNDNPHTVKDCRAVIIAQTRYVEDKAQLEVTKNGQLIHFDFNEATGTVTINNEILEGTSNFEIVAKTEGGAAVATRLIKCEKPAPVVPKPVVTFITPAENPYTAIDCQLHLKASVLYAEKANINVSINGIPTAFEFDEANKFVLLKKEFEGTATVKVTAKNTTGSVQNERVVICKPKVPKPLITILEPAISPFITENCKATVVATVLHVTDKSQIAVSNNGKEVPFSFDPTNKKVSTNIFDIDNSKIQIKAQNESGFAQKEQLLKCIPPPPKPTVEILKPTVASVKETLCKAQLEAKITPKNVDNISVTFGGLKLSSAEYNYDENTGKLYIDKPYEKEVNILITANNESGKASASVTFNCEKEEAPIALPEITLISPKEEISSTCQIAFTANVLHVENKDGLELYDNGQRIPAENFSFVNNTIVYDKVFGGKMTLRLVAKNTSGEKSISKTITCKPPVPNPIVKVIAPTESPFNITSCETTIKATVLHATQKEQIKVTQNGKAMAFTFDPKSEQVSIEHEGKGRYEYVITVVNESGEAKATQTIVCTPPAPEIKFLVPNQNPFNTDKCNFEVKASVLNVEDKSAILVRVNGQPVNFIYHTSTKLVTFPLESIGESTVTITATTPAGNTTKTTVVKCAPIVPKPTVTIIRPNRNPFTTQECDVILKATTENITTENQVKVTKGGKDIPFRFNPTNGRITVNRTVADKETIVITVSNEQGEAVASQTLECVIPAPSITMISPTENPYITKDCQATLKAQIEGIKEISELEVYSNGAKLTKADYSFSEGTFTYALNDFEGTAVIEIVVTNTSGKDTETVELTCIKEEKRIEICHYPPGNRDNPQTISISENAWPAHEKHGDTKGACPVLPKPTITISEPAGAVTEVNNCRASVFGKIEHIKDKQSIAVKINGDDYDNFSFDNGSFALNNYEFQGEITVSIKAKNGAGETTVTKAFKCVDKKIGICHYPPGNKDNPQYITISENAWPAHEKHGDTKGQCPVLQKPVLNIQQPGNYQSGVTDCVIDVKARSYHILEQKSITVTIDNTPQNFTWDGTNIAFQKKMQPGQHKVVMKAKNAAGEVTETINYSCPAASSEVHFGIENGTVIPEEQYNAEVKVIGCALKSGSQDLPVMVQVDFGGKKVDPFGSYNGYNKNADVNDGKPHTWTSKTPISAKTAIAIKAKSFMPGKTTPLYERSSNTNSQFVKVLRNGDPVPNVSGYAGQKDAEAYLKPYISGSEIKLEKNQAIYLFELGVKDPKSPANDMQDCVIVVTLTPVE